MLKSYWIYTWELHWPRGSEYGSLTPLTPFFSMVLFNQEGKFEGICSSLIYPDGTEVRCVELKAAAINRLLLNLGTTHCVFNLHPANNGNRKWIATKKRHKNISWLVGWESLESLNLTLEYFVLALSFWTGIRVICAVKRGLTTSSMVDVQIFLLTSC